MMTTGMTHQNEAFGRSHHDDDSDKTSYLIDMHLARLRKCLRAMHMSLSSKFVVLYRSWQLSTASLPVKVGFQQGVSLSFSCLLSQNSFSGHLIRSCCGSATIARGGPPQLLTAHGSLQSLIRIVIAV